MEPKIRAMKPSDWCCIAAIYKQGIDTGKATSQSEIPSYDEWDCGHIKDCRSVACDGDKVVGWVALSSTSSRYVYRGVAEVSIYIDENYRGKGIGSLLMERLIAESEKREYWTLQSGIFEENVSSIMLHGKTRIPFGRLSRENSKDHRWRLEKYGSC
jgi:phosphinothricin acetyltransferase